MKTVRHLAPSVRLGLADAPEVAITLPADATGPPSRPAPPDDAPHAAGLRLPLALSLCTNGTVVELGDGSVVRRLAMRCRACSWVSAHLEGVDLREGERLFVHGSHHVGAQGAYDATSLRDDHEGSLATPPLPGGLLVIELYTPARLTGSPPPPLVLHALTAGTSACFDAAAFAARDALSFGAPPHDRVNDLVHSLWDAFGDLRDGAAPPNLLELPWLQVVLGRIAGAGSQNDATNPMGAGRSLDATSAPLAGAVGAGGACMVDVSCDPAWADISRGVVALLVDGGLCTGSLLNVRGGAPLHGIVITNSVWCIASKGRSGGGFLSCANVMQ